VDILGWEALQLGQDPHTLQEFAAERPAFMSDAACREHPEISWFPERGDDVRPAKAVCAACLVQAECAAYAATFALNDLQGIWGGMSGNERRRRRWPKVA